MPDPSSATYLLPLDKPVRFLVLEWRESWEFDFPSVLLEPVVSYSPNGTAFDSLMEDAAIDLALAAERNEPVRAGIHPAEAKEFAWRGWNLDRLRRKAERLLKGKKVRLGIGYASAHEQWVVFQRDAAGEVNFEYVSAPTTTTA